MKNQFFGDNRDLVKYDLIYRVVKEGLVDRFTYIPMLTGNEVQKEEPNICRFEASAGTENKALMDFLDKSIINGKRDVRQLEEFFPQQGIPTTVYGADMPFTHDGRKTYFDSISQELLTRSIILIDPDKGLEEDQNGSGTLLYYELRNLYERMDDESYLMLTQRFPYDLYTEYLGMRTAEIKDRILGSQPISIDDLDSIIFFLTKNKFFQGRLVNLLKEYTKQYAKT